MSLIRPSGEFIGGKPNLVYCSSTNFDAVTANPMVQNFDLGRLPGRDSTLICAMLSFDNGSDISSKITVNGEATYTSIRQQGAGGIYTAHIFSCPVVNSRYVTVYPGRGFTTSRPFFCGFWLATGLTSHRAYSAAGNQTATATVRTADVSAKDGGFVIALASNNVVALQTTAWTGDTTPTERADEDTVNGTPLRVSIADTFPSIDDAANTITATFGVISTSDALIVAAAFR